MEFFLLDLQDPHQRHEYERAFYQAFAQLPANQLVRELWVWDDAMGTLQTRVPYEHQIIYGVRDTEGHLDGALAVNYKLQIFQSSAFGFSLPQRKEPCCELLSFFALRDRRLKRQRQFFWSYCCLDLYQRGYDRAFATTAERPLHTYLRMRGNLLAQTEIAGEKRYFLEFHLSQAVVQT